MKRLLIVLIVCVLGGIVFTGIVSADTTFGSWDKWDESLPSWDNKGWQEKTYSTFVSFPLLEGSLIWLWVSEDWQIIKVGRSSSAGTEDVFFLLTRLSFIENKKLQASILLFSPAQISSAQIDKVIKNISVRDALAAAKIAIVVFPSKKGEVIVRAYEKNASFLFLEEWISPFKNETPVFSERTTEFTQKYESWINDQFQRQGIEEGKYRLSPKLIVTDEKKKEFFIGVALEVFDGEKIKTPFFF